jgi:hypothetical protein
MHPLHQRRQRLGHRRSRQCNIRAPRFGAVFFRQRRRHADFVPGLLEHAEVEAHQEVLRSGPGVPPVAVRKPFNHVSAGAVLPK